MVLPEGVAPPATAQDRALGTLAKLSVDIRGGSPEDFAGSRVAKEREKWSAVAKAARVQID